MMKPHSIQGLGLALGLGLLLAPLARADEPAPDPKSLAMIEAILDHCAKVDPAYASNYQKRVQLVTQGADEETLAKVRESDEYQKSRESTLESLAKVDHENAKKVCGQSLGQNK